MYLTPDEYAATKVKIAKLNTRAVKRGWTGTVTVTGTPEDITETGPSGLPVTRKMVNTEISGTAPKYDGWTFLARIEWTDDGNAVTFNAPGVDGVYRPEIQKCDHCGINRYRTATYIVRNDDGRSLQVGSTCLKDFLGWNTNPVWISEPSTDDLFGESGYGHANPSYATETVLAASWAVIQEFGFSPASSDHPTKYVVASVLDPRTSNERALSAKIAPHISEAVAMGRKIREFILSDEFYGTSDYVVNLKNVVRSEFADFKFFGFLCSAPQAWAKAQERDLVRRQERAEIKNEWNGQIGDKLELTVTLKSIRYIDGYYGVTDLYTFVGADNRVYKWFSSRTVFTDRDLTKSVKIRGTVKKHDEYKGSKSTNLTRVKVI